MSTPLVMPTTTGPVKIPLTDVMQNQPPDLFRYSDEQIREMFQRGQSETVERSGESDSGLPYAGEAEQSVQDADATAVFMRDSVDVPVPEVEPEKPSLLPLVLLAGALYFLGG